MTDRKVALLRGINVGRAKRVAMADLRAVIEALGYTDVKTLLNSGNVVFTAHDTTVAHAASRIEGALLAKLEVASRVTVLTAADLAAVVETNPLCGRADNPSRLLVSILANPADRARLENLVGRDWSPDLLALGPRAAYLWLPEGILVSPLADAVSRALGDTATSRNWGTLTKLHALAGTTARK